MSDLDISRLQNRAYAKGYSAGLREAREAVRNECFHDDNEWCVFVAAIDGLLEDTHITNITKEPNDG